MMKVHLSPLGTSLKLKVADLRRKIYIKAILKAIKTLNVFMAFILG